MSLVIGLSGKKGSGKTTFYRLLKETLEPSISVDRVGTGDFLLEELEHWNLPGTTENTQKLPLAMAGYFDEDSLMNALRGKIEKNKSDVVVFDALRRREADVNFLRSFPNNLIVYLYADPGVRWKRLLERAVAEEAGMSFKDFLEMDNRPIEQEIEEIGYVADVNFPNNEDSLDSLMSYVNLMTNRMALRIESLQDQSDDS